MTLNLPVSGIQRAMNLVMPLADPSQAGVQLLANTVFNQPERLTLALDSGGTIHFARFVIIGENLVMASSYDGEFSDYIQMFIDRIGDIFDSIMGFVSNPAPTPVQDHPDAFVSWVHAHDQLNIGFYRGYPDYTTQQIRVSLNIPDKAETPKDPPGPTPEIPALPAEELCDVQGLILRGFGHPFARHIVLRVIDPQLARRAILAMAGPVPSAIPSDTSATSATSASLLGHDPPHPKDLSDPPNPPLPTITSSVDWGDTQPSTCWALALTATGLSALGVPQDSVRSFPVEFLAGATSRGAHVGDIGPNSPDTWADGFNDPTNIHVLLSLYAADAPTRDSAFAALEAGIDGAFFVVKTFDGQLFANDSQVVHFGYLDNISQPFIAGDPVPVVPDHQPRAAAGDFVLGYKRLYKTELDIPQPDALGKNGSFTSFRILEQDVVGFEEFLDTKGSESGIGTELLAAKVIGRWRNGVPLALSPDTDSPTPPLTYDQLNNYGYLDDPSGLRCPVGAHMRRANPRDQPMKPVGDSLARRIMRRAMPYGPQWKPGDPPDTQPRGLVGHFIGASLLLQFETIMGEWINTGMTEPGISGTNDALLGPDPSHARLDIPSTDGTTTTVSGFGPFVRTRAGIYGFLPSLSALRWIGGL
jgi:deferrochelatase/peroxidase EfeB